MSLVLVEAKMCLWHRTNRIGSWCISEDLV